MTIQANPDAAHLTALILSGGGAAGSYEVGVMKALFSGLCASTNFRKLDPDIFAGTSVGALNATFVLSSPSPDLYEAARQLEYIYLNSIAENSSCDSGVLRLRCSPFQFLDLSCYLPNPLRPALKFARDTRALLTAFAEHAGQFLRATSGFDQRAIAFVDIGAFVDDDALRLLVQHYLNPVHVHSRQKCIRLLATNWEDGSAKIFTEDDLTDAAAVDVVMASAAIPAVFPQVKLNGADYADGGIVMNSPLSPSIQAGADDIHLVYVDPLAKKLPSAPYPGTAEAAIRSLVLAMAAMVNNDVDIAERINLGLAALHAARSKSTTSQTTDRDLLYLLGSLDDSARVSTKYKPVTVHRYRPDDATGGPFRWLNFSREAIAENIELGYQDTLRHDCTRQQCLLAPVPVPASGRGEA